MATIFTEIDVYGRETSSGNPLVLNGDDAIENAIVNYCGTRRGALVREPLRAGIFDNLLYTPVRSLTNIEIDEYAVPFSDAFGNFVNVLDFNIEPDYENNAFVIQIGWSSKLTAQQRETSIALRNQLSPTEQSFSYVGVDSIGDNLYFFVMSQQPSMPEIILEYNIEASAWIWGKYVFTNFSETDPRYSDILNLIG